MTTWLEVGRALAERQPLCDVCKHEHAQYVDDHLGTLYCATCLEDSGDARIAPIREVWWFEGMQQLRALLEHEPKQGER